MATKSQTPRTDSVGDMSHPASSPSLMASSPPLNNGGAIGLVRGSDGDDVSEKSPTTHSKSANAELKASPSPLRPRRLRRGSSPPDPQLLRPPHLIESDSELSDVPTDDGDYNESDEDEDDDDFIPAYANAKSVRKGGRPVASSKPDTKSLTPSAVKLSTPQTFHTPEPSSISTLTTPTTTTITSPDKRADVKLPFNFKLAAADEADMAAGSPALRKTFKSAFDAATYAQRAVVNLAQDELGRVIVWLSSIKAPAAGTKVKYEWPEAFGNHLHGRAGGMLEYRQRCEAVMQKIGWDGAWEKHALHKMGVPQRLELVCCLMSMYLETKRPDAKRGFVRVKSVPETDWDLVCKRQMGRLPNVYFRIKMINMRLNNLCRPEIKKGKVRTPLSKEYIVSDDDGGAEEEMVGKDEDNEEPLGLKSGKTAAKRKRGQEAKSTSDDEEEDMDLPAKRGKTGPHASMKLGIDKVPKKRARLSSESDE